MESKKAGGTFSRQVSMPNLETIRETCGSRYGTSYLSTLRVSTVSVVRLESDICIKKGSQLFARPRYTRADRGRKGTAEAYSVKAGDTDTRQVQVVPPTSNGCFKPFLVTVEGAFSNSETLLNKGG